MKTKVAWIISISIISLIILAEILYLISPATAKDLASYLSAISTLGILVLTSVYVIFTNRQIIELQKQRDLQLQPCPHIEISKGHISPPRLTVDFHGDGELSPKVDIEFEVKLHNVGNGAAIQVDGFPSIAGQDIKPSKELLNAYSINVLEDGKQVELPGRIRDEHYEVLKMLCTSTEDDCPVKNIEEHVVLVRYYVVYKNTLGVPFLAHLDHSVFIDPDHQKTLSKWLATVLSFEKEHSSSITKFNVEYKRDKDDAMLEFEKINKAMNSIYGTKDIKVLFAEIPGSFNVKVINDSELERIEAKINRGFPVAVIVDPGVKSKKAKAIERRVIKMSTTGEKPGKGTYMCNGCGQIVVLDDDSDTLPPCPSCNGTSFTKR